MAVCHLRYAGYAVNKISEARTQKKYMNYLLPTVYSNNLCPAGDGNITTVVYQGTGGAPAYVYNNTSAAVGIYSTSSEQVAISPAHSTSTYPTSAALQFMMFSTLPGEMFSLVGGFSTYRCVAPRCPPYNNSPLAPVNGPLDLSYSWNLGAGYSQPLFITPTNFAGPIATSPGVA